jgi:hypothetical protein
MNASGRWYIVGLLLTLAPLGWGEEDRIEVTGDRVNLRGRPRTDAEVLGQLDRGQVLERRGATGEWVAVAVPDTVSVWVATAYVSEGRIQGDRVYIRAGPSQAYPTLGHLRRGEPIVIRRTQGEWTEIVPPTNATAWVHRDHVRPLAPAVIRTRSAVESQPVGLPEEGPPPRSDRPREPTDSPIVPSDRDVSSGGTAEPSGPAVAADVEAHESFEGILKPTGWLDIRRMSDYALVDRIRGRPVTICYVHGNPAQLKSLVGRRMIITGPVFRREVGEKPLVLAREIVLRPANP